MASESQTFNTTNHFYGGGKFLELTSDATGSPMYVPVDKITQVTIGSIGAQAGKVRVWTEDGDLGIVVRESMRMIKARLKKLGCDFA